MRFLQIHKCSVCKCLLRDQDELYVDVNTDAILCDNHSFQDADGNAHTANDENLRLYGQNQLFT